MVDQLHLSDRILQNLLLKQLKPTFAHVMNPNCYHLHGPSGVKLATRRMKEALALHKPKYIIRADIKSYYKSIRHHILLEDIRRYYNDPQVVSMLENYQEAQSLDSTCDTQDQTDTVIQLHSEQSLPSMGGGGQFSFYRFVGS